MMSTKKMLFFIAALPGIKKALNRKLSTTGEQIHSPKQKLDIHIKVLDLK